MPKSFKETRAVVVDNPIETACQAFGSVNNAAKALKLSNSAFYNWRQSRGIPLSVYRVMEKLRPGTIPAVETQKIVRNGSPFRIASSVVSTERRTLGPMPKKRPALEVRLQVLEAENVALRTRLEQISSLIR